LGSAVNLHYLLKLLAVSDAETAVGNRIRPLMDDLALELPSGDSNIRQSADLILLVFNM